MIITHLNTGLTGGAAIAARRLHESLLTAGAQSRFCYSRRARTSPPDSTYQTVGWPQQGWNPVSHARTKLADRVKRSRYKAELKNALRGRPAGLELFSQPRTGWATPYDPQQLAGDILQLHWVAGFIDYATFFPSIPDSHPVVWTLHDMNPLTGGCHYSGGCDLFTTVCNQCPQLGRRGADDLSHRLFSLKLTALRGKNLHVVAPSRWLYGEARRSRLLADAKSIHHIPYGLDVDIFSPQDKRGTRQQLGLPNDHVIIGWGAENLGTTRKGTRQLLAALRTLNTNRPILVVAFGGGEFDCGAGLPDVKTFGYIRDSRQQALVYSAMDLFVMPSLEDNLPQTGLEAMACGTPVVAFAAGGAVDYVRPGETGLLAPVGDAAALSDRIRWLVEQPHEMRRMGRRARQMIEREYAQPIQASTYQELYRNLLEEDAMSDSARHVA